MLVKVSAADNASGGQKVDSYIYEIYFAEIRILVCHTFSAIYIMWAH